MEYKGRNIYINKFVKIILITLIFLQISSQSVQAQSGDVPFNCDPTNYIILSDFIGTSDAVRFEILDLSFGVRTTLASYAAADEPSGSGPPIFYNAAGYNVTDNMIWGYDHNAQSIFRIDANYDITYYSNTLTGLPDTDLNGMVRLYMVGDISPSGELYITDRTISDIFVVDLNPDSPTYLQLINTISFSSLEIGDWAFHPYDGYIYTLTNVTDTSPQLYRIDPDDGSVTILGPVTGDIPAPGAKNFFAHYMDDSGNFYVVEKSNTYEIYEISDVASINVGDSIVATSLSSVTYPGPVAFWSLRYSGDGARCINYSTDYGDAPDTYDTTYRSDGAVHSINPDLFLGTDISRENDAPITLSGTQDDYDDGVNLAAINTSDTSYTTSVVATNLTVNPAYLYGWIDFDGDGVFSNSDERSEEIIVTAGTSGTVFTLTWNSIPADIAAGSTYARIRLFGDNTNLTPADHGGDGEVEDYPLTITSTSSSVDTLPATGFAPMRETILAKQSAELAYSHTDMVLNIPSLGISKVIVGVPQTSSGWNITWLGEHVGYLFGTALPTWKGNTVLTGHVWDANGSPGVFSNLKDLGYGDVVAIDAWGQRYIYEVRSNDLVEPDDPRPLQEHSEYDMLTLLTCKDYDEASEQYLYRVLVKAVLQSVEIR